MFGEVGEAAALCGDLIVGEDDVGKGLGMFFGEIH